MSRPIYLVSKTPYPGLNHIPVLTTQFLKPAIDFRSYDALIVTSKQAIDALECYGHGWKRLPLLCVSAATAAHAEACDAEVLHVGKGYADSLPELIARYHRWRWLFVRAEVVASDFVSALQSEGVAIDEKIVYKTACNSLLKTPLAPADAILIFTAPSAIACFLKFSPILATNKVVVIGKTTYAALPEGIEAVIANEPSIESAVESARALSE